MYFPRFYADFNSLLIFRNLQFTDSSNVDTMHEKIAPCYFVGLRIKKYSVSELITQLKINRKLKKSFAILSSSRNGLQSASGYASARLKKKPTTIRIKLPGKWKDIEYNFTPDIQLDNCDLDVKVSVHLHLW